MNSFARCCVLRETAAMLAPEVEINLASIEMLLEGRRAWIGAEGAFGDVLNTHLPMSRAFVDAAGSGLGLLPTLVAERVLSCYTQFAQIEETRKLYQAELARLESAPDAAEAYQTRTLAVLDTIYFGLLRPGAIRQVGTA